MDRHNFTIICNDTADNFASTVVQHFLVDTLIPAVNFTSPTPGNATSKGVDSVYVNVSSEDLLDNHSVILDWNSSLVLWMRFDNRNSSEDPLDSSSYGNDGSAKGDAVFTQAGKFGGGFEFDGLAQGRSGLLPGDEAHFGHAAQHVSLASFGLLGIQVRRITAGRLGNAGQDGGLRQGQVFHVFGKKLQHKVIRFCFDVIRIGPDLPGKNLLFPLLGSPYGPDEHGRQKREVQIGVLRIDLPEELNGILDDFLDRLISHGYS